MAPTAKQPGGAVLLKMGMGPAELGPVSEAIMQSLLRSGFCQLACAAGAETLSGAVQEAQRLEAQGGFARPPEQVAEGLLGAEGSGRLAYLEERSTPPGDAALRLDSADPVAPLRSLDDHMYDLGQSLGRLSAAYLGFELRSRDRAFLLEAGSQAIEAAPVLAADEGYQWLTTFEAHRLMCLLFLGPGSGVLTMQPFDDVSGQHQVTVLPGTWVILRADMLSHYFVPASMTYVLGCFYFSNQSDFEPRRKQPEFPRTPVAKALDSWLLETVKAFKETAANDEELEAMTSRAVQRMTNQMYHKGAQVAVRGQACRFPGDASSISFYSSLLFTGTDAAERIPGTRWDNDVYYVPESTENLTRMAHEAGYHHLRDRYNCEHGSFIDGIELFDNRFFGLSVMESKGMDPNQRHLLETCYEVAFSAGLKKPMLMRAQIGVYTAGPSTMECEWLAVPKCADGGALGATNNSSAILSNRLSYAFGMNGPNFLLTADAASSLIALGLAADANQSAKPQCDAAFVLGIDMIMHPVGYSQYCWARQMSQRGRCLAFDHTADGYIRSEGSGGVYLNPFMHEVDGEQVVDEDPRSLGLCCGVWTAHTGKAASLTAPSGSMDQELIAGALRAAEISPLDVDAVDVHGASTVLADAVEVMALCRALRGRVAAGKGDASDPEILGLGCAKTTFGNGKPLAGMFSIIKVVLSHELGQIAPSNHLFQINPHIMIEEFPAHFVTEHLGQRMNSCFSGITAKGFGGSCAHALLWGAVDFDRVPLPQPARTQQDIVYWPGGGGELEDDMRPNRHYAIVGTWSSLSTPETMKAEGRDGFSCVVEVGELGFERFQVLLDGDPDKVLHPGLSGAMKDSAVLGPDKARDAVGSYWLIGCGGPGMEAHAAQPGERYQVHVLVNGKYRIVTWSKLAGAGDSSAKALAVPSSAGQYFLQASWNDWVMQAMPEDSATPGVYRCTAQLLSFAGGAFCLARNQDGRQLLYPELPRADDRHAGPAQGPDEHGRGHVWVLSGAPGDVFEIELQRSAGPTFSVTWRRVGNEQLTDEQLARNAPQRYFVVGSWDGWTGRHLMTLGPQFHAYPLEVRGRPVSFRILEGGDWHRTLHPGNQGLSSSSAFGGGFGDFLPCWTVGGEGSTEENASGRFEVRLELRQGRPFAVTWSRA